MEILNVETALFSVIGWALLLGSAATVLVPVLVWIGNLICAGLWHFIDEGETDYKDRFTSLYFGDEKFPEPEVTLIRGRTYGEDYQGWGIKVKGGLNNHEFVRYISEHSSRMKYDLSRSELFETESSAVKFIEQNRDKVDALIADNYRKRFKLRDHMYLNVVTIPVGAGLLFIPTITLVAGSALLSLYAMRWARRGVKLAKKVKGSLESHIADKEAHK